MKAPFPNTFLIGAQKAGSTSLDNWIAKHPQVYAYSSLKDMPLFVKFTDNDSLNKRLLMEKPSYKNQKIVLHTAVNYMFYPSLIKKIAEQQPDAKLLIVLRNPVERAISAYLYFHKMLREKRSMQDALIYKPQKNVEISRDNNDLTYIEHGLYYNQIKNCLQYFSRSQLLILNYDELKTDATTVLKLVFGFLNIDEAFTPKLAVSNITGELKSRLLHEKMFQKNSTRTWLVNNILDPWLPVNKRRQLKKKFLEMNTNKEKTPVVFSSTKTETLQHITNKLRELYLQDISILDEMLGTSFCEKWFMKDSIAAN